MKSLLRLFTILRTIGKYRLQEILPQRSRAKARLVLFLFGFFPKREKNRAIRLRLALEELGPIFIKFGQILSTRPDLLPPDLIEELVKLQDRVQPFDADQFRTIVEASLGKKIEEVFNNYEHHVLASASIAQVHAAELKDGQNVVIKVVRPDIASVIEKDTSLLLKIAQWVETYLPEGKRLRPVDVVNDYRETILDELDLVREGANAAQLRRNFEHSDMLYIPKVFWEYTSTNVLVLERINGIPINDVERIQAQGTNMKLLAARGVEIFFTQVFDHNFFHADMHPGNVFVSKKNPAMPSYIGIDTAIVGSLTREDQYYLARNMLAMFRRDYRLVAELHVTSGWVPAHTSVSAFESAIRSVCEPIFQKPLKDISFGEALISLFRTAQRFEMPVQPQLVLLQKTLLNIEGLGRQLYPELDLWETAHPFLEKWLKKRYSPINLAKELQYQAPEWLEKIPQLPSLMINALQTTQNFSATQEDNRQEQRRELRGKKRRIALLCTLAATASLFVLPSELSVSNSALALIFLSGAVLSLVR